MAILGKLLSEGLEEAGQEVAEKAVSKAVKKASKEGGESILSKLGRKIPVSDLYDVPGRVAVRNIEKNPYTLEEVYNKLVNYKKNPEVVKNIANTGVDSLVERTAKTPYRNKLLDSYDLALDRELGASAGPTIDALRDYTAISTPQQFDAAKANMKKFLDSPDAKEVFSASRRARGSVMDSSPLYRAMNSEDGISYTGDIRTALAAQNDGADIIKMSNPYDRGGKFISPEFTERFNPGAPAEEFIGYGSPKSYTEALDNAAIEKELASASNYLPKTPLYHSSDATFDKFDDAMLGSATGYGNTKYGHFLTPDEEFSQRFGKNTMQFNADIQKPITHPYGAGVKYSDDELNKIVADWLDATDNLEGLDYLKQMVADGEYNNLYDGYMGTTFFEDVDPYEYAADERKLLKDKGYDAIEIVEGQKKQLVDGANPWDNQPVSSYVMMDADKIKKYLPEKNIAVSSSDAIQDIPVYTKDDFITDPSIFDDPAFADIVKNNNIENVMKKGTKSDLELVKRAKAGEVLTEDEIRNSRFAKNLGIDAKKAQLKYGNKLNITKAMEEGKEKVKPELEKRLRGMADQVLDRLHKDPNIKYDHKAVIFMGGPSSGKSSAGMKLYDAAKGGDYAVIDSDDIKPMFEEFGKGEGAGAVHLASAYTAKKMVLPDAAAEGMNLALPIVGKSDNALNYHLNLLKNAGYDVSVVDVSLPTDKAASRNFGRMMETNRNVEDTYVRNEVDQRPAEVYRKMVENIKSGKDKRVSGYAKISNDVKFGEPQILEEISPSDVLKRVQDKFGKKRK